MCKSSEDIIIWPDDSWCYREELDEGRPWKSDDYTVIPYDSEAWYNFHDDLEEQEEARRFD